MYSIYLIWHHTIFTINKYILWIVTLIVRLNRLLLLLLQLLTYLQPAGRWTSFVRPSSGSCGLHSWSSRVDKRKSRASANQCGRIAPGCWLQTKQQLEKELRTTIIISIFIFGPKIDRLVRARRTTCTQPKYKISITTRPHNLNCTSPPLI